VEHQQWEWKQMVSKTTLLLGEYELTIDEKGRLLVPAEVRRSLDPERDGEAFIVSIGMNGQPWLYPERGYEALVSSLTSQLSPGEDTLAFDQLYFSMASREEWDKQGRLSVPLQARRAGELARDITMIGVRDHLELWNRDAWEVRKKYLIAQRAELAAKQREAAEKMNAAKKPPGQQGF
jgi:transcriptional regulator MraZ